MQLVYQLIFMITKYCDTTMCSIKCWSLLKRNRLDRNQPNMDILDIAMHWCAISNLLDKLPAATYNDSTQVGYETNIDSYACHIVW